MNFVTGATGLVGSHLLYELTAGGHKVRAAFRKGSNLDMVRLIFSWYNPAEGDKLFEQIEWVETYIDDYFSLREALEKVKTVYHCAALVSFQPSDRKRMLKINVEGTANLVNACLNAGIEKLCHCSSVAALGNPLAGNTFDESISWKTSPRNTWYAISKYGAEREVWRGSEEGLRVVIVNPSIIIGPGDISRSSAQLYKSVKKGLRFYTKGITGFVDVRDVARIMLMLAESTLEGERFIVSSQNLQYKQVFEMFALAAGTRPPDIYAGPVLSSIAWRLEKMRSLITVTQPLITRETARNANSIRHFSNEKIIGALGFRFRTVEEAVNNTVAFYQKFPKLAE
ncbi:MAG TPA: NAD-dependent epimerase/dehydratase family protein [Bacteroidales bacterium]|nr:NAD-dependent epimerase/dehydratase family protein [Bacteroidales bacterium]